MTRSEFICTLGGASLLTSLAACTPYARTLTLERRSNVLRLARADAPELMQPDGAVRIDADGLPGPLLLMRSGSGLTAVSLRCTHRGCEVRKVKDGFECPCHGSAYTLAGDATHGPASDPLARYRLRESETLIEIIL